MLSIFSFILTFSFASRIVSVSSKFLFWCLFLILEAFKKMSGDVICNLFNIERQES